MFRIHIYLNFLKFIKAFFFYRKRSFLKSKISQIISSQSKKQKLIFSSQCRVSFLFLLKYLKQKKKLKNEIIFSSYNLPEMVNVAKNLNFKVRYCDLNFENGFIDVNKLKSLISKKTSAVVLTNMFNSYKDSKKIKKITKKLKIDLIEDNAIYFDNYTKIDNKKYYSGSIGDYTIYSFNIMKNVSAMYGGALATNNKEFINYYKSQTDGLPNLSKNLIFKQSLIFLILKIMGIQLLYKTIFFSIIKFAHENNIKILLKLFYPSLKFKIIDFPKSYFSKISNFSLKLIYLQLIDKQKRVKDFNSRKNNNIYYYKLLSKIKNKNFRLIEIEDFNYQNFIDFPIIIKNKEKFNKYLLKQGIEARYIYYRDCERIFQSKNFKCKNSNLFEKELLCLPNNKRVNYTHINKIVKYTRIFLSKKD
mgnify:CR=1 FL=1